MASKGAGGHGPGGDKHAAYHHHHQQQQQQQAQQQRRVPPSILSNLPVMMYGCGDSKQPLLESVDLVGDLVVQHIQNLTYRALQHAEAIDAPARIETEAITHLIRHDHVKLKRVSELLEFNADLRSATRLKLTEEDDAVYDGHSRA